MIYGIPEPGSYFKVPEDDDTRFECEGCGEWFEEDEKNAHDAVLLCGWCLDDARGGVKGME